MINKYSKPNTTAQIFWLKNRKNNWTDRNEIKVDGEMNVTTNSKLESILTQLEEKDDE